MPDIPIGVPPNVATLGDIDTKIAEHNVAEAKHGLTTGEYLAKTNRADQLVARAMMEYPTENISLAYLHAIGKLKWADTGQGPCIVTIDSFTDKCMSAFCVAGDISLIMSVVILRFVNRDNYYFAEVHTPSPTADPKIVKRTGGVFTGLALEAIDITDDDFFALTLSVTGANLSMWRQDVRDLTVAPTLTATDTDHTSGGVGIAGSWTTKAEILPPASKSPEVIGYYEIPIIGSGSYSEPYRAKLPEFVEEELGLGKVNRLALSHSSLIPSDERGHPLHSTAIVRIFSQPNRQPHLRPIEECILALKALPGVIELTRDEAIARAKGMNPKLKDEDLTPEKGWG